MPKLNKCINRIQQFGFVRHYKSKGKYMTHYSSREWFRCGLVEHKDETTITQLKCKGMNCGKYSEAKP
jgi:hypothetical protein